MDYRLTLLNKIKLKLRRHLLVGEERKNGWKDSLPVYAFKCPKHGLVKNHVKGFSGVFPLSTKLSLL